MFTFAAQTTKNKNPYAKQNNQGEPQRNRRQNEQEIWRTHWRRVQPWIDRRVVPVIIDGLVSGWKMQRCENNEWLDMDDAPFESMQALIEHYKSEK